MSATSSLEETEDVSQCGWLYTQWKNKKETKIYLKIKQEEEGWAVGVVWRGLVHWSFPLTRSGSHFFNRAYMRCNEIRIG